MKRISLVIIAFFVVFSIGGCAQEDKPLPITKDTIITMDNVDDYLFRQDVQYVDLRNFNSRFLAGYIDGFEPIPFFEYLDYRAFDREDTFQFKPDHIRDTRLIESLFDKEKAILLYADGCIRSLYVKDLLDHLGYERVYVIGGFFDYKGDHIILGDGDFTLGNTFYSNHTSSEHEYTYIMSGSMNVGRKITAIRFDIIDEDGNTLRSINYDSTFNYNSSLTNVEEYIVDQMVTFNDLYVLYTTNFPPDLVPFPPEHTEEILALINTLVIQ